MWLILANYAVLAATFALAKRAVQLAHPLFVIGFRMTLAGAILLTYLIARDRRSVRFRTVDWPLMVKVAFFHIYLAFILEFWSLQFLPSFLVNLVYATTPFIAAGLSYLLKDERLNAGQSWAMVLGLMGIAPTILQQPVAMSPANSSLPLLPLGALAVSVISSAYAWFDIQILMRRYNILLINAVAMLIGGVAALVTAQCALGAKAWIVEQPLRFGAEILLLIGLSNVLFYNLFGWLLQRHSLTLLTFAGLLSPAFGAVYGALMGERIDASFGLSLLMLSLALALFCKSSRQEA